MGCFNTLIIYCPACNDRNDVQSKAGSCTLTTKTLEEAEAEDVVGLGDREITCGTCKTVIRFVVNVRAMAYIAGDEEEVRMQDWQKRVVEEQLELAGRVERLEAFTKTAQFKGLDRYERELLRCQLLHMEIYLLTLNNRIAHFIREGKDGE